MNTVIQYTFDTIIRSSLFVDRKDNLCYISEQIIPSNSTLRHGAYHACIDTRGINRPHLGIDRCRRGCFGNTGTGLCAQTSGSTSGPRWLSCHRIFFHTRCNTWITPRYCAIPSCWIDWGLRNDNSPLRGCYCAISSQSPFACCLCDRVDVQRPTFAEHAG